MTNFSDLVKKRRSIRKFTDEKIQPEHVELILKAGLMSPTSKNSHSWHFIAVEDKEKLEALSKCKNTGKLIAGSTLSIIVAGDPLTSDVWVEDCSIAAIMMQLQAEDLNIGSCWVQVRGRETDNGGSSEEYVKDLFDLPMQLQILAIIAFGHKEKEKSPQDESKLLWENVHIEKF
ncbi:nitroreductase family protein [Dysgonomonas sp. 520]|uniref:nitroreductase family protein n=1 Tax=Dysgonomonas sp. 520 TaxID=2302931 RepID=UPI0013D0B5F0|nr:nitroreductase family protein [Dysgonomonas sp. 520]NDW09241.1 NAD(P)H nitroreductase [Dysgonomonas sp. 520]